MADGQGERLAEAETSRPLQTDRRIDDCIDSDGWIVFAGMDFSRGDDLNGAAFLCYNTRTNEFFGDMDVYMSEEAVNDSPIRELLDWERRVADHLEA